MPYCALAGLASKGAARTVAGMEWLVFALVMVPAVAVTQWLAIRRSREAPSY